MTPGERLVRAHRMAARAVGRISFMLAKHRIVVGELRAAEQELGAALGDVRTVLSEGQRVPKREQGQETGDR